MVSGDMQRPGRMVLYVAASAGKEHVGGHIRSGVRTPSIPRPLASTWRVASQSASRGGGAVGGLFVA